MKKFFGKWVCIILILGLAIFQGISVMADSPKDETRDTLITADDIAQGKINLNEAVPNTDNTKKTVMSKRQMSGEYLSDIAKSSPEGESGKKDTDSIPVLGNKLSDKNAQTNLNNRALKLDSQSTSLQQSSILQSWYKYYGGSGEECFNSVVKTSDGGYLLAGDTTTSTHGGLDFFIVKIDSNGNFLYSNTAGSVNDEWAQDIALTNDGGFITVGCVQYSDYTTDVKIIKFDQNGNMSWSKVLGGAGYEFGNSILQASDGGFVITGSAPYTEGSTDNDMWLVKTDYYGNTTWTQKFGGTGFDDGLDVKATSDGGYIIAGSTSTGPQGMEDAYIVKTNSYGSQQWYNYIGANYNDSANAIVQASDGGYVIAGSKQVDTYSDNDTVALLFKINSQGSLIWNTASEDGYGVGYSINTTNDGGYIAAGELQTSSYGKDAYIIKTDANGYIQNTGISGGNYDDAAYSIVGTNDGGYLVAGNTESFGSGVSDGYVFKLTTVQDIVAAPSANPTGGTYTSAQSVTLSSTTSGASIYYTLDGTTPTIYSSLYTYPITVSTSCTIKAIAVKTGMTNSAVSTFAYTIMPPVVAPTANPAGGTYTGTQSVTLSSTTSGASIYYTLDGTTPTTLSSLYTAPITVSTNCTIKAIAVKTGMTNSTVSNFTYTIVNPVVAPVANPASGTYSGTQSVTLSCTTPGASIYYTLDGTTPTTSSPVYASPITISTSCTIKAIAVKTGMTNSTVATFTYTITPVGLLGDVNNDNAIDTKDAVLVLKSDVGMINLTAAQKALADVNKDGAVDTKDAVLILKYDVGLIHSF